MMHRDSIAGGGKNSVPGSVKATDHSEIVSARA